MLYLRRGTRPQAARAAWALVLAMGLLLAFACSGSGDDGNGGDGSPKPGRPTQEGTEAPSDETPSATASPEPLTLEQLAARFIRGVDGKVTYRYTSSIGFKPDGVWTTYELSGDTRDDWQAQGSDTTTTVIAAADDTYVCTQTTEPASCTGDDKTTPRTLAGLFAPATEVVEAILAGIPELETAEVQERTIAGVEARCFEVTLPAREEITICFAADGQLLMVERTVLSEDPDVPTGELSLEAQEVGDASAADFEPLTPVE